MTNYSATLTRPSVYKDIEIYSRDESAEMSSAVLSSPYTVIQQVKFLHLQAEVETLLLQLQSLRTNAN
ncbi:MAG: hypothetical protein ACFBSC_07450 [Microcoleaceae cyanobacterium]